MLELLIQTLWANLREILSEIHTFSFKKMHLKMMSGKLQSFCLGLNVLMCGSSAQIHPKPFKLMTSKPSNKQSWILYYHCKDTVTSLLANGRAAFFWKLPCHWLKCLHQHHFTSAIQAPGWVWNFNVHALFSMGFWHFSEQIHYEYQALTINSLKPDDACVI